MNKTRMDCPKCFRKNSVAIYTNGTDKTLHCFGADCKYHKRESEGLTMESLNKKEYIREVDEYTFVNYLFYPEAQKYLEKYQANHITDNNVKIKYDTKLNRLVFMADDVMVGRSLTGATPKWYVYKHHEHPFIVRRTPSSRCVLLVEDAVSACNASRIVDSMALLGTNLKSSYLEHVMKYDTVIIALDEDATSKALKIYDVLKLVRNTIILPLKKDIKYYSYIELDKEIRDAIGGTFPNKIIP